MTHKIVKVRKLRHSIQFDCVCGETFRCPTRIEAQQAFADHIHPVIDLDELLGRYGTR